MNLTSGNLRNLLLMDETGEMVYSRDLLVNSDNELWIGAESGVYIYNLRTDKYVHLHSSKDDPYSFPIMPFIRCVRIVKVASG